jgi:hypothetical protein
VVHSTLEREQTKFTAILGARGTESAVDLRT